MTPTAGEWLAVLAIVSTSRANPARMAALMAGVAKSLPTIEEQTP